MQYAQQVSKRFPESPDAVDGDGSGSISGLDLEGHRLRVAAEFTRMVSDGESYLPLPGSGGTRSRWHALTEIAERDLALARLAEGHTDATAILAELDSRGVPGLPPIQAEARWAVWAAEPPSATLQAHQDSEGRWQLSGRKPYCSGARVSTDALVTTRDGDRRLLFAVQAGDRVMPVSDSWPAVGMAASDTLDIDFDDVPAALLGAEGAQLDRPGFQHGGIRVAACWYGAALPRARYRSAFEPACAIGALSDLWSYDVSAAQASQQVVALAVNRSSSGAMAATRSGRTPGGRRIVVSVGCWS